MKEDLFYLYMKDKWNAADYEFYERLIARQATPYKEEYKAHKVGDIKTDDCGTWQAVKIDNNGALVWALV